MVTNIFNGSERHILKGKIRVYEKDKSGNPIQLFIQTDEFEKYIIENSPNSEELFNHTEEEILINYKTCFFCVDKIHYITVENFRLLKK